MLSSLLSLYTLSVINLNIGRVNTLDFSPSAISAFLKSSPQASSEDSIPIKNPENIGPVLESRSAIAIDLKSGMTLYEKNAHARLPIASITKLMTILIVLEENNLDDVVEISQNAAKTGGTLMFLRTGERITVENLLYGALIHSANDAAVALAEFNAGDVDKFVAKMNEKASQLGLLNTHFSNPIGLDEGNNYSSAYDISKLAQYIYQKKFVREAATLKELKVQSLDKKFTHELESTDELLDSYLKIKGLKTGTTDKAGQCLVSVAENDNGNTIIDVLLNSPSRFTESKILIDWVFRSYNWKK